LTYKKLILGEQVETFGPLPQKEKKVNFWDQFGHFHEVENCKTLVNTATQLKHTHIRQKLHART